MSQDSSSRMPAVFFGHGSPMNALGDNQYTAAWEQLGRSLAARKPKAILAISAHWYTRGTAVTAMAMPKTIHDFGGFPQALFDVQYPAKGDPELAEQIADLLAPVPVHLDHAWGLDHGTWSVLIKAFPQADVPVIQLSIDGTKPAQFHFELGQKLAVLREQGVLIIGSGDVVHNLRMMSWDKNAPAPDWAVRFNDKIRASLLNNDVQQVVSYENLGQDAALSVPTAEHFLPLLYVIGCQHEDEKIAIAVDGIEGGTISMLTAVVGELT